MPQVLTSVINTLSSVVGKGYVDGIQEGVTYTISSGGQPVTYPSSSIPYAVGSDYYFSPTYLQTNYTDGSSFTGISGYTKLACPFGACTLTSRMASSDLPSQTHDEIIRLAANMILENIEQPRYQTHSLELARGE